MSNSVLGKTMENSRKHKDIKLVTTEERRNYLVFFSENLLTIEMKRAQILLSKPVYLALSIFEISKIVM